LQRYELRKQWSLPLPERVARGYAIEGLEVTAIRPNGTLLLSCQTNDSRFREGDYLVINRGDPETSERLSGILEYDDKTDQLIYTPSMNMVCASIWKWSFNK
jgi:DNA replication ATP-dependent helicase/nuclease Dna2